MKRVFPAVIALATASVLILLTLVTTFSAPSGFRWLGDGMHNPSDVAVYLSYLRQGAEGHVLLADLFAVEPHLRRFDPIWSTLGLVARTGLEPIVIHEAARALFSIFLVIALWFAARSITKQERDAKLGLALSILGVSTGWIYSIWLGSQGRWTPTTYAAPDIVTEFSVWPILMGGAHAILSLALLVTAVRLLWTGIRDGIRRSTLLGAVAGSALLSFHPYFAPLLALIGVFAFITSSRRKAAFLHLFLAGLIQLPPILYYAWLLRDPVFGAHHLTANLLPLAPLPVWLLTLLPFLAAFVWMWKTKKLPTSLDWRSAWILATVLLLIALPVPWKRKLTEGLAVPLVFLTLPAWIAVRDWVARQRPQWIAHVLAALLFLAAGLGPLHLLASHLAWIGRADARHYFYQPTDLFSAASFLRREATENDVLLSDDAWTNVWLPALTGRRVWIGHDHETPNFVAKREAYRELLSTTNAERIQTILRDAHVTYFVGTTEAGVMPFATLLDKTWTPVSVNGTIVIWKRIP